MKKNNVEFYEVSANDKVFNTLEEAKAYALESMEEYREDYEEQLAEAIENGEDAYTLEEWAKGYYYTITEV